MENTAHQLTILYMSRQEISQLTPEEFADKYCEVYEEIYKILLENAGHPKESRISANWEKLCDESKNITG